MHLSTIYTKIDTQKSIIFKHFKSLSDKVECVTKDGVTYQRDLTLRTVKMMVLELM